MSDRLPNKSIVKSMETEVLILGAGAAGCGAAVGASEMGSKVLLVEKGKLESSGSIGSGNDHFIANLNSGPEWDSDEALIKHFSKGNRGVPLGVIQTWVKVIPSIIKMLEQIGLEFVKNGDGSYFRSSGLGNPNTLWLNIRNGQFAKRLLAKKIRASGIDVLDHVMITRLLKCQNRVIGAIGFDVLDGSLYILRAKSTVLALGSQTPRASSNSTHIPFNTWRYPYNSGCYCVLAYEAGAKIINLDTDISVSLLPKGFGCGGMNGLTNLGGHALNAFSERFMDKYDAMGDHGKRQNLVLGTYQETIEGKGPPFFMDMRHLSSDDLSLLQYTLMPGDKATFNDYMAQKEQTFATHPLEVEISETLIGGRLVCQDNFETTVRGLFSGCNFFSFSGALCGGYGAGIQAAKSAANVSSINMISESEVAAEQNKIFEFLQVEGITPIEFERAIRQVMDYYMGFVKNEKGIDLAIERLNLIEKYQNKIQAHNMHELMRANEARFLLKQCQLTARAVKERRETGRTTYKRSDYPNLNPEYNSKCLTLWQESGEHKIDFLPAP
jgi:adenylylsulfate reductase subunit A